MTTNQKLEPLVTIDELAQHLHAPGWVTVDCRFNLMDPDAGRRAYAEAHIPGAFYADLDADLSSPRKPGGGGRHPLPTPQAFQRRVDAWGLATDSRVVCYDDAGGAVAARLWWLLRWAGLCGAAVLDGGWRSWLAAEKPVDSATAEPGQGGFIVRAGQMPVVDIDGVEHGLESHTLLLLDARDSDRFAGRVEPIDSVAGHVPGALNAPFQSNLTPQGQFRNGDELRDAYTTIVGSRSMDGVACMCGSGVTACHTLLALEQAGLDGAALYVGSWSDWISAGRPIATAGG